MVVVVSSKARFKTQRRNRDRARKFYCCSRLEGTTTRVAGLLNGKSSAVVELCAAAAAAAVAAAVAVAIAVTLPDCHRRRCFLVPKEEEGCM